MYTTNLWLHLHTFGFFHTKMKIVVFGLILLTFNTLTTVNAQVCEVIFDDYYASDCSVSCGAGTRTIQDRCCGYNIGGDGCTGINPRTVTCTGLQYANGNWGQWDIWSPCSVTCGTGTRDRRRSCDNPAPQCGGINCVGSTVNTNECYVQPVHGGWSAWSQYTPCTKTCGTGSHTRSRICSNPTPANCGNYCSGSASQTTACNTHCCPESGYWGQWETWSSCSVTCGQGSRERHRYCNDPAPICGGSSCLGSNRDTIQCFVQPVHGGWSAWSQYTPCTKTCSTGSHTRSRICSNPTPANCGNYCSGSASQTIACNTHCCRVNGNWGKWEPWSSCSVTCGQGTRERYRYCNNPAPSCGGPNCVGSSSETLECFVQPVHGGWSEWSQYPSCSKPCGTGSHTRTRVCNNPPPTNCGNPCSDDSTQTTDCNTDCCPVGGNWSHWTDVSQCSVTCGQGTIERERECNNPAPFCGGEFCAGDNFDTAQCNINPVNGGWGQWSQYDACSKTCGNETHTRRRECNNPAPAHCGAICSGYFIETHNCNTNGCSGDQTKEDNSQSDPEVTGVWPTYGPKAGRTMITVHGLYFPDSSVIVIAQDIYCETLWVNNSVIISVTPELTADQIDKTGKRLPVALLTDSSWLLSTGTHFIYKANPLITNVYPLETIIKGGTYLTVEGDYLNSVAETTMTTTMILRELASPLAYNQSVTRYETTCTTLNLSMIICPTPRFVLPPEFTFGSNRSKREIQRRNNERIITTITLRSKREVKIEFSSDGDILEFYIGFNMDGVDDYKNYSLIDVYVEPEFQLDGDVKKYKLGERLIFEGAHLDIGVTKNDYKITIGTEICDYIQLTSNALSCLPPETEPDIAIASKYNHPRIMIHVGINIAHMAGYLHYPARALPLYVIILSAVIPACFVSIIVITVSVVCVKKRQAKSDTANDKAKACNEEIGNLDNLS